MIISLISHIEKFVHEIYEIVHDQSDNLRQYDQLLSQLVAARFTESFQQTQITTLNFPLKLSCVSQVNSRSSYGVQLADLLIGGMIEYCMSLTGEVERTDYNQAVIELYGEANLIHLLPNWNFEEDKEFRRNTKASELIKLFARNFS